MPFWNPWRALTPTLLALTGSTTPAGAPRSPGVRPLDRADGGLTCRVVGVNSPAGAPDWGRWLGEIGFLPGELVTVTARSPWGGDPMVVRVGQSTFALRRAEAACVQVEPL
jgi:ferrous iron transport protein A